MDDGKDLIGKRVKHITDPDNANGVLIEKVQDGKVYFSNNGRADISIVRKLFEETQNPIQNNSHSMPNSNVSTKSYDINDPNSFFSSNSGTLMNLANQIKNIDTNNVGGHNMNNSYVSQAQPPQIIEENTRPAQPGEENSISHKPVNVNEQPPQRNEPQEDPWLKAQFDNDGEMKKVDTDQLKKELDQARSGMSVKQQQYTQNMNNTPSNNTPSFPKMKKNTSVKLNLTLEEKIPKPESIKNMNDLFEESIIDVLAKEITTEYVSNPNLLEDLVREELERIVYKKRKPRKTSTTTNSKTKKTTTRKRNNTSTTRTSSNKNNSNKKESE